jgi:hypothetical protein
MTQFSFSCLTDRMLYFSPRAEHIAASLAAQDVPVPGPSLSGHELSSDRFFEARLRPEAFGSQLDSPFLAVFSRLSGGLGESFLNLERAPDNPVWERYFGPISVEMRATPPRFSARFILSYAQ